MVSVSAYYFSKEISVSMYAVGTYVGVTRFRATSIRIGSAEPCQESHPLLYARIPGNRHKVRQFGVLFPIPQLAFAGNRGVKE